jgi:hypothetical protein
MVTEKKLLKTDLERQVALNDELKAELAAYQTD